MSGRISAERAYEALTTMVLAIHEDPELSDWFANLGHLSSVARRNEVHRMRQQLLALEQSPPEDILASMMLLADERVFLAAQQALDAV